LARVVCVRGGLGKVGKGDAVRLAHVPALVRFDRVRLSRAAALLAWRWPCSCRCCSCSCSNQAVV
ncbi:hypothetical protein OFC49_31490, partial [Escherichia coli]|nr:hypothetical protein [Escherichia coli]